MAMPKEDFLQNTFHFPSFRYLPHENDVEDGYWEQDQRGVYRPACTWFFMAEITNDELAQIPMLRNRVGVRDRAGQEDINVFFYPEQGFLDFHSLQKGSTLLVTNGQKHDFLDLSTGLRIEQLDTVAVVPCGISDLLRLSKLYHERRDTNCWSCGKEDTSTATGSSPVEASGGELKKCGACKMARY